MALTYKGISVMKKTREASDDQITIEEKRTLVQCLRQTGITHIEITMFANENDDLIAEGFTPSPRTIEAETQQWYDVIHENGLRVLDRAIFCDIEGISGFAVDPITPIGTAATAAADGLTTWCGRYYNYLLNHVTPAKFETGDIQCPIPEITGHMFTDSPATVTMTIASPAVVTYTSHGLSAGTNIHFTTTGALPTGIVSATTYYVSVKDANSFWLYDTRAHALASPDSGAGTGVVNTSGTQSGTHSAKGWDIFTDQTGAHTCVKEFHLIADALYATVGKTCVYLSNPNFSEVSSGYWGGNGVYTDTGVVCYDYYGGARGDDTVDPAGWAYDIDQVWAGVSPTAGYGIPTEDIPQFFGEWGDLASSIQLRKGTRTGSNFVTGTTLLEDWMHYWREFFKMLKEKVDDGKIIGFNYWGGWENQNTSIVFKTGTGADSVYTLNWRGQMLSNFFKNNAINPRLPVIQAGTYTEATPSFGGRNMYF